MKRSERREGGGRRRGRRGTSGDGGEGERAGRVRVRVSRQQKPGVQEVRVTDETVEASGSRLARRDDTDHRHKWEQ